jgi:hypothetical protein
LKFGVAEDDGGGMPGWQRVDDEHCTILVDDMLSAVDILENASSVSGNIGGVTGVLAGAQACVIAQNTTSDEK